jgi:hypothetical protein
MGYALGIYLLFAFYDAGKTDSRFIWGNISITIWIKTTIGLVFAVSVDFFLWKEKNDT